MPSKKQRVNLTVSDKMAQQLQQIAEYQGLSVATVALDLIERSLELHEDEWLLDIITEREKTKTTYLTEKQVWR